MEKMDQKVCLDTDVVITILNNLNKTQELVNKILDAEIYITTITLFELLQRENNLDQIEVFRSRVKILDLDELASRKSSLIFKSLKKNGRLIDIRDIFIAGTCISHDIALLTLNKNHFERLKEFNLNLVD